MTGDIFIITAIGMSVVFSFLLVLIGVLWAMQQLVGKYLETTPDGNLLESSISSAQSSQTLDDRMVKQIIKTVMQHKNMQVRIRQQK